MAVPRDKWEWFGHPAHLCVSSQCVFHLATKVGAWVVSTVGEYKPISQLRANPGSEFKQIGYDRLYETMVFAAGKRCDIVKCGCGLPAISGDEKDMQGYNTAGDATRGHMAMCRKWAKHSRASKSHAKNARPPRRAD